MKFASRKSALKSPVVYSTDRSKAVVPVFSLTLWCFVVYSARRFVVCLTLCNFYAPNFEEAGGAYCFWVVRPSFRPSVRPFVTLFDA